MSQQISNEAFHIFFLVNVSLRWINNVSCLFLSFPLITSGVYLCIVKSGLACCLCLAVYWSFSSGVGVAQSSSQWEAGADNRRDVQNPADQWKAKKPGLETWRILEYTPVIFLSQRKLAVTARNTLFCVVKLLEHLKNLKTGRVPYLVLTGHACHQKPNPPHETVP